MGKSKHRSIPISPEGSYLEPLELDRVINGKTYWICKCKKCGKECSVLRGNLTAGRIRSCGCLVKLSSGLAASRNLYAAYRQSAKRRQYPFGLTFERFIELTKENCVYCGASPAGVLKAAYRRNGETRPLSTGDYIYNGIDRIDPRFGYVEGNVFPCCKRCNIAKGELTFEEFIELVDRIHAHVHLDD